MPTLGGLAIEEPTEAPAPLAAVPKALKAPPTVLLMGFRTWFTQALATSPSLYASPK